MTKIELLIWKLGNCFLSTFLLISSAHANTEDSGRVINGHDVPEGKYPFIVSLQQLNIPGVDFLGSSHFCGGSVLNDNTILTAAHCVDGQEVSGVRIYVGGHNIANMNAENTFHAVKAVVHPKWNGHPDKTPDIAIIKLNRPIDFKKFGKKKVMKSCLPTPSLSPVGPECVVIGWGKTETGDLPKQLQELKFAAEKTSKFNPHGEKNMHYHIDSPKGSGCFGDSGSPLICPVRGEDKTVLQFGIASFITDSRCRSGTVYTNVALYLDWVKELAEKD